MFEKNRKFFGEKIFFPHNKPQCRGMHFTAGVRPETQKSAATCPDQKVLLKKPNQTKPFKISKLM